MQQVACVEKAGGEPSFLFSAAGLHGTRWQKSSRVRTRTRLSRMKKTATGIKINKLIESNPPPPFSINKL
jgi:hypothetical protein